MSFEEADRTYPYDPKCKPQWFTGIDKLQAFEHPRMRRAVFDLWVLATGGERQ